MNRFEPSRIYAAEELALRLEQQIVEQALRPGDRLGTKAEIAAQFGYSGGTVNEAVILLETRGMLEARPGPGGGLFSASPVSRVRLDRLLRGFRAGSAGLAECRSVRSALEPTLCFDAARLCDRSDATELRGILAGMQGSAADPAALLQLNWALHRRIAEISANALLRTLYLTVLHCVEEDTDDVEAGVARTPAEALAVHEELVEALIEGGEGRLGRAVERHTPLCG
jgi:DNA-binding FadR family transcriptional regulator